MFLTRESRTHDHLLRDAETDADRGDDRHENQRRDCMRDKGGDSAAEEKHAEQRQEGIRQGQSWKIAILDHSQIKFEKKAYPK